MIAEAEARRPRRRRSRRVPPPAYKLGDQVATREAYGDALAKLGAADPRVVALDADVKNSTFSDKFEKVSPDRFYENFIAEQVMVGAAMGLAARGAIPFPSTFACFLARAADFVRMAAISNVNVKLAGLARRRVDWRRRAVADGARRSRDVPRASRTAPSSIRATRVSTERLVALAAGVHTGPAYMRTTRPKTPVIYSTDETFPSAA